MSGPPSPELPILYDDDCAFCKWCLDKILAWDRRGRLRTVPIQCDEGQTLLTNVPSNERLASWHLVLPSGEVRSAGAAAGPLARLLPLARPLAFVFERFPRATDSAYRSLAAKRARFGRALGIDATCELRR
jgi:predicted DCC family thiol-disulfide oxidoreductase YuxK